MTASTGESMTAQISLAKGKGGNKEAEECGPAGMDTFYVRPYTHQSCSSGGPRGHSTPLDHQERADEEA